MDLIEIINILNIILQPHFYLVDEIYSDIRITNFEKLIGNNTLFWKLNGQNKKLINANKQNEL
jgi:hypothetical protein